MLPMISIVIAMVLRGKFIYLYSKKYLIVFLVLQILFGLTYIFKDRINPNQSSRGNYPAPEIAQQIYLKWHSLYPTKPLKIVSGGEWEAGYVSLFSPDKTYVFTQANSILAPWISDKDVQDCGMVMLNPNKEQLDHFESAKIQEPIRIINSITQVETVLEYAISPPLGDCQLK